MCGILLRGKTIVFSKEDGWSPCTNGIDGSKRVPPSVRPEDFPVKYKPVQNWAVIEPKPNLRAHQSLVGGWVSSWDDCPDYLSSAYLVIDRFATLEIEKVAIQGSNNGRY